jgi:hypothetical protein
LAELATVADPFVPTFTQTADDKNSSPLDQHPFTETAPASNYHPKKSGLMSIRMKALAPKEFHQETSVWIDRAFQSGQKKFQSQNWDENSKTAVCVSISEKKAKQRRLQRKDIAQIQVDRVL